ncbi:unnamed protein product [Rotaria sordida]|uniref:Uncharacterized protein n=1 Tax=Rotaria sordida TaxID=392033 RepID=A0A819DXD8_9BILA|nr:unnamed protein product [Rotaria sordida]CAF3840992.1 unnamed protein product [Rotaria sordida]
MKHVLRAAHYPNLDSLALHNIDEESIRGLFTDKTYDYNELIPPLLYRMSNQEKLSLYLLVYVNETFIDGNHLKRNIINRMPRLNQFTFYIRSSIYAGNKQKKVNVIIYSYPPVMNYYGNITNYFSCGLFKYVRVVSLYDEYPFEHEIFLRIVQSFPFMEQLTMINHA